MRSSPQLPSGCAVFLTLETSLELFLQGEEATQGDPVKKQKADEAFVAAQGAFKEAEPVFRETERVLASAIAVVVAAKGKDDADFLATIVEAQAARAAASKEVLTKLQPALDALPAPTPPPAAIAPVAVPDDVAAAPPPAVVAEPEVDASAEDMLAI